MVMNEPIYVLVKDNYDDIVIGQGMVKNIYEKNGEKLISFDGHLYCKLTPLDRKYSVQEKTEKTVGEPINLKYRDDYTISLLSGNENTDLYIDLNDSEINDICEELITDFKTIFNTDVKVDYENGQILIPVPVSDIMKYRIFGYEPAGLQMFEVNSNNNETIISTTAEGVVKYIHFSKLSNYLKDYINCNNTKYDDKTLVYYNNMGRRSFQWELWAMCNNLCKYCYLGTANRGTNKERQMKSLNDIHKAIDNLDFNIYNNISLIGGEFFQGQMDDPEIHDSFMALIQKICDYYNDGLIGSIWITVTMTIGDQHHLYEMLDLFEKNGVRPKEGYGASGLWLCTSWDIEGRFHTPEHLKNWEYHIQNIHEKYPWVKFNCTIILMQKFLEAYINGEWSPKEFMNKYHTGLFYKQIGLGEIPDGAIPDTGGDEIKRNRIAKQYVNDKFGFDFAPRRETMLKFLRKYAKEDPETYDNLFNIVYRADELHRNFNDKTQDVRTKRNKNSVNESDVEQDNRMNTCGHILNYACYIDSDKCCICDKKMIWESIYGDVKWQ